jgi:hypothetical protein
MRWAGFHFRNEEEVEGIIEEANMVVYLGLQISRSAGWKLTEQVKLRKLMTKMMMIKAKVTYLSRKAASSKIMWEMAARPQWEYGLDCIHSGKTWMKKIEIIQNKMAKWIAGTSQSSSATGVLGEVGWTHMTYNLMKRKFLLWGKIMQMPDSRIVRKSVRMMATARYNSSWLEEIRKISEEYHLEEDIYTRKDWKRQVKIRMKRIEWNKWSERATEKDALIFYHKTNSQGQEPCMYFAGNSWAKAFCQARLGDVFKITGSREERGLIKCQVCGQ